MTFALIENGVVTQIWDERPVLHPDFMVIEADGGSGAAPGWRYVDGSLVAPSTASLDSVKAARVKALSADCGAAIISGYLSDALGAPHTYPSNTTDQINMMGSVTASLLPALAQGWSTPFWCRDAAGAWAFRLHSAAQIQQAGSDGKAHVVDCQTILEMLAADVMAAATAEAVAAIVWPAS